MATIVEGSLPLSVETTANVTQHGASKLAGGFLSNYSGWQIAITAFLCLVVYDQCTLRQNFDVVMAC